MNLSSATPRHRPCAARTRLELPPDRPRDRPALDTRAADCQRGKTPQKQNRRSGLDRRASITCSVVQPQAFFRRVILLWLAANTHSSRSSVNEPIGQRYPLRFIKLRISSASLTEIPCRCTTFISTPSVPDTGTPNNCAVRLASRSSVTMSPPRLAATARHSASPRPSLRFSSSATARSAGVRSTTSNQLQSTSGIRLCSTPIFNSSITAATVTGCSKASAIHRACSTCAKLLSTVLSTMAAAFTADLAPLVLHLSLPLPPPSCLALGAAELPIARSAPSVRNAITQGFPLLSPG